MPEFRQGPLTRVLPPTLHRGQPPRDTVDQSTRSRIMSSVGQKDTGAETILRFTLHKAGFRYRLHVRRLPGSPDLVFPRFGAVVPVQLEMEKEDADQGRVLAELMAEHVAGQYVLPRTGRRATRAIVR
jgi:DNA mismatch endonuclease Vsr